MEANVQMNKKKIGLRRFYFPSLLPRCESDPFKKKCECAVVCVLAKKKNENSLRPSV